MSERDLEPNDRDVYLRWKLRSDLIRYETEREPDEHELGPVAVYATFSNGSREKVAHVVWHSPTGFEYGYGGSGPADLALSILADFYGLDAPRLAKRIRTKFAHDLGELERRVVQWHQPFKRQLIETADRGEPLLIHRATIVNFIADQIAEERGVTR